MNKRVCPISMEEFLKHANPMPVRFGDHPVQAEVKDFSTGSFGWNISGKMTMEVNGKKVDVQLACNLIVIDSKNAPRKSQEVLDKVVA